MRALIPAEKRERLLAIAVAVTVAVALFDAVYLYGVKFGEFVHSDAASVVLMAKGAMARGLPVDLDWYFANGDVWLFAPHLYAMPFLAMWGVGPGTLLASIILGYALEAAALYWAYGKLGGDRRGALLGTAVTLIAWSRLHILFVYIELSYGFVATLYIAMFAAHALLFARLPSRSSRAAWIGCAVFAFVAAAQNPTRAIVFAVAPLVGACVWPWRGVSLKTRAIVAGAPVLGLVLAMAFQKLFLQRLLTFSTPSGHLAFQVKDASGIAENVANMARGLVGLTGDMKSFGIGSAFGLALLVLALVVVVRYALGRDATALRFACLAALAQLAVVAGPMLIGNLVVNAVSIRYLIPSLLTMLGLAAVIAVKAFRENAMARLPLAYCTVAPFAAALSAMRIVGSYSLSSESTTGQFAHTASHQDLADEIRRRDLHYGFGTYWNAHLLTLLTRGSAKTCPINFANVVLPYRWHTDTWCYDPARLPDRFFVVVDHDEHAKDAEAAVAATMGTPIDRFTVGTTFDVHVFETAKVDARWLAPPIPDADRLRLPLRVAVTHPQVRTGDNGMLEGPRLVAKGTEGNVSFGPYIDLPAGDYRVRWIGVPLNRDGEIGFDAVAEGAKERLAEKSVPLASFGAAEGDAERTLVELELHLTKRMNGVELRTYSRGGARVALAAFELSR